MTFQQEIDAARIDAVIFDLDGVITKTADVHETSWIRMFNDYLERHAERTGEPFVPFASADYLAWVDGKPRYDGVQSFLESRDIHLPWGSPKDSPDEETVCGLGNRKNLFFLDHLRQEGVEPYRTSVDLVRELQRHDIGTALISSSQNVSDVLASAGLSDLFSVVVDGVTAKAMGIPGKPDPAVFLEAAARLGARPSRSAIVEDALSGVEAGSRGEFALVIGVNRADQAGDLSDHGATVVVSDLDEIKVRPFPASPRDHLPDALADMGALIERLADRSPAVFLDYDGTLTPIVAHPDLAVLSETTRAVITELASLTTVAVLSGRDVADVRDKMGVKGIYYAGSHGFDILGPDGEPVAGERLREIDRYLAPLEEAGELLERRLEDIDGSQVERKRYAIAVHFRRVEGDDVSLVEKAVHEIAPHFPQLRVGTGKKVLELRPDFDWDKGRALNWLLSELGLDNPDITPVYLGDDTTDEDAFRAIRRRGIGIVVGQDGESTHAQWMLETTDDVRSFLAALADRERNR